VFASLFYRKHRSILNVVYISIRLLIVPIALCIVGWGTGLSGEKLFVLYFSFIAISGATFDIVTPFFRWVVFYKADSNPLDSAALKRGEGPELRS